MTNNVTLVPDPVGRDNIARSYSLVKKDGIVVTIVSRCDEAELKKHEIRGASLSSHPDATELAEITKLIDDGKIKPIVSQVLPLTDAAKADAQAATHHTRGKIDLRIADEPTTK